MNISLPKEKQKEITTGNFNALIRFLKEIHSKMAIKKPEKEKLGTEANENSAIDIKNIRKYDDIGDSESVLELVLILITQNLGLTNKQAVATLSESAKYLAHMFVKGIKGSFDEIETFLVEVTSRMSQIMYLT